MLTVGVLVSFCNWGCLFLHKLNTHSICLWVVVRVMSPSCLKMPWRYTPEMMWLLKDVWGKVFVAPRDLSLTFYQSTQPRKTAKGLQLYYWVHCFSTELEHCPPLVDNFTFLQNTGLTHAPDNNCTLVDFLSTVFHAKLLTTINYNNRGSFHKLQSL